jgi:myosin-9
MWHSEKIYICVNCRFSCHKKCHTKVNAACSKAVLSTATGRRFFGADLVLLTGNGDDLFVPPILNTMLLNIELKCLFIEGLYRKSGSLVVIKKMRNMIELAEGWLRQFN